MNFRLKLLSLKQPVNKELFVCKKYEKDNEIHYTFPNKPKMFDIVLTENNSDKENKSWILELSGEERFVDTEEIYYELIRLLLHNFSLRSKDILKVFFEGEKISKR